MGLHSATPGLRSSKRTANSSGGEKEPLTLPSLISLLLVVVIEMNGWGKAHQPEASSYVILQHIHTSIYRPRRAHDVRVRFELPPIVATSMITPTSPDAPSARITPLSAAASSGVG